MKRMILAGAMGLALAGCGLGGGARVPQQFIGTWGSDCSQPFVRFERMGKIHVFPDGKDYRLKTASYTGSYLIVSYRAGAADMTDTYLIEGPTLRLTQSALNGITANWNKQPMMRCIGPS